MASKPRKQQQARTASPRKGPIKLALFVVIGTGIGLLVWSQFARRNRPITAPTNAVSFAAPAPMATNGGHTQTNVEAVLPNDPIQLINYGGELLKLGQFAKAVQLYTKALEINPEDEEGHFGLGVAYGRMGRTNEAIQHYEDALKIFPDYYEAHNNLGNIYREQGEYAKAIQHYLSALKVQPEYTSAMNNLGLAVMRQGKMGEALHYFREAVNLDTNYFEARFNLGSALLKVGETNEAAGHFNEILRQKPGFRPAEQMLARIQQNPSTNKP